VPARLHGWRRRWGVAMDNRADLPGYKHYLDADGTRPAVCVAFLDVVPDARAAVDGLCVPVGAAELAALDARERNYVRVEVTGQLDPAAGLGRVWTYTGREDSRARFAAAAAAGECVIARGYLEAVAAGFRTALGDVAWARVDAAAPRAGLPVRELLRVDHAQ
jgi:hypothetical protein